MDKSFFLNFCKSKLRIVWNWFIAKNILNTQNICFKFIQNGRKSGL